MDRTAPEPHPNRTPVRPDYDRYADAIATGRVRLSIGSASVHVDDGEAWNEYGIPCGECSGAVAPLPRFVAVEVIQQLVREAGVDLHFSGTFEWGVLPRAVESCTAAEVAGHLIATRETNRRASWERLSAALSDGQRAADSI